MVDLPAIVLEVQKDVGATSMKRSLEYCLQISEQYSYEVYFILLCTDQISRSIKERLSANLDNLYRQQLHSDFWAKTCLFILKATISSDSEDAEQDLDLLQYLLCILLPIMKRGWNLRMSRILLFSFCPLCSRSRVLKYDDIIFGYFILSYRPCHLRMRLPLFSLFSSCDDLALRLFY